RDLAMDMAAGRVDTLLMLDANPVYDAPADLEFATYLDNVRLRIHVGLYHDETAFLSHWHVPLAHELESWSDARAFDGVATVIQPLIAPLYGGRTVHDVTGLRLDQPLRTSYEWVRRTWQDQLEGDFESAWRQAVHDGVIPGTASPVRNVRLMPDWASRI